MRLEPLDKPSSLLVRIGYAVAKRRFGKVPTPFKIAYARAPKIAAVSFRVARLLERGLSLDPALVQLVIYLGTAPKSNAAYKAAGAANRAARETGSLMPPKHILNAPTRLMKDIGYGKGYAYDHDADDGFSGANYWPSEMEPQTFYRPVNRGFEAKVTERLAFWEEKRRERNQQD